MAESKEARNKALVLDAFDTLFNKRDYEAAERYWSPNYIQHSAHIEPGRDGLFNLIRNAPHTLRYEHQLIVTEGDYVIVHGRFSGTGRPVAWVAADRERPPCRTLGGLTRRGDKSRIAKRVADVRHNVSCVDSFARFACSITRLRKCSGRNK
jgi:predicted SnoaL-like aldol condensation-catalyzing enzyme